MSAALIFRKAGVAHYICIPYWRNIDVDPPLTTAKLTVEPRVKGTARPTP